MANSTPLPASSPAGVASAVKRGLSSASLLGSAPSTKKVPVSGTAAQALPPASTTAPPVQRKAQTSTPGQALHVLSSNIFPSNVCRQDSDQDLPNLNDKFVNTPQLVFGARLLTSVSNLGPSSLMLNAIRMENAKKIECRKKDIDDLMMSLVHKFDRHSIKGSETIREIVLLGPILNKENYRWLIKTLLAEFNKEGILMVDALLALVQLIQNATPGHLQLIQDANPWHLQSNDLVQVLRSLTASLKPLTEHLGEDAYYLAQAISKVLDVMADCKIKELDRKDLHEPLLNLLWKLKEQKEDPFVQYQARYAIQALLRVPDGETATRCFFRHFVTITGGLVQMTEIRHLDISGVTEGLTAVIKGGRGFFDVLRKATGSGAKKLWYQEVRGAEALVRKGELANLNKAINEATSLGDPWYRWGICQLLGEIVGDSMWDQTVHRQAIVFLGEMYKISLGSFLYQNVRRWILTILTHISKPSSPVGNNNIKSQAQVLVQGLKKSPGDDLFDYPYLLASCLPLPLSSSLLNEVNNTPNLDLQLDRLQFERLEGYSKPPVYIPPMSKTNTRAVDNSLELLEERVCGFLNSAHGKVMLILGDSGAGKSTFNLHLEHELWLKYQPGERIPLFVDLKTVDVADKDMIKTLLVETNLFSEVQIIGLRESRKFILICDGYDECRNRPDLYANNKLNRPRQWQAKLMITCRSQYLTSDYKGYISPNVEGTPAERQSLLEEVYKEAIIVPFDEIQIRRYIEVYVAIPETRELFGNRPVWTAGQFMDQLQKVSPLMDLVKNPFLLTLMLSALPRIAGRDHGLSMMRMTRVKLFDEYVMQHYQREMKRLIEQRSNNKMSQEDYKELEKIANDFVHSGIHYSMQLSVSIFKEQKAINSVSYSVTDDRDTWKVEFFDKHKLLRESSPLVRSKNSFKFFHRSIMEYLFTCTVYEPKDPDADSNDNSDASALSPYLGLATSLESKDVPSAVVDHPFGQQDLLSEPSIIHFLAERVQQSNKFKEQLLAIIQLSKTDSLVSQAATNAITILVHAGVQFNGVDLQGVQIPGADLTGGHFHSAQFQGSNLGNVNFSRTLIRQADFSKAQMIGVRFGENSFLQVRGSNCCTASPDGKDLALGLKNGSVKLYSVHDMSHVNTYNGLPGPVHCLAFSNTGHQLAAGVDAKVEVWDRRIHDSGFCLEGHSEAVTCLAFSPEGHQLVTGSEDCRIWDLDSRSVLLILFKFGCQVDDVAWSPDGMQIASVCKGTGIRVWKSSTGELIRILDQSDYSFTSIAYSPDMHHLVASSEINGVYLFSLQDIGSVPLRLGDHPAGLRKAAFSKDGKLIASSARDNSVRFWNTRTGSPISVFHGHGNTVEAVFFLTDQAVASFDVKGIVKIWDVCTTTVTSLGGTEHTTAVSTVSYTQNGKCVISCQDSTICLWDSETGSSLATISSNTNAVSSREPTPATISNIGGEEESWDGALDSLLVHKANHCHMNSATSKCRRWFAVGKFDGSVSLRDQQSDAQERELTGHESWVLCVAFSPSGHLLASSSNDKTIRIWDVNNGDCMEVIPYKASVLSFAPCGSKLAIGSNNSLWLCDLQTKENILTLAEHTHWILCIAWSPCGQWIASVPQDGIVKLWRIRCYESVLSGSCEVEIQDFNGKTLSIDWNPANATEFVTGCEDCSVCVWKVIEGEEGKARVEMKWESGSVSRLTASGANITDAIGLSQMNRKLLRQHDAIDETPYLRDDALESSESQHSFDAISENSNSDADSGGWFIESESESIENEDENLAIAMAVDE